MQNTKIVQILELPSDIIEEGISTFRVNGWVRTIRDSKNVSFIVLNDGSTFKNLQVVVDSSVGIDISKISSGASIDVVGTVVKSKGVGQIIDFEAKSIDIIGEAGSEYPIQPKRHTMEFFREYPHLRTRTQLFQAIFRIRHKLKSFTHTFFDRAGFISIDTPIITGSDCEGAGETFKIDGEFFGKEASLTVSGQLEAETAALAFGSVYTFGPTFRAENSNTTRHLAEFWMIEPEMAFANLDIAIGIAELYLKISINYILEKCQDELEYLEKYIIEEEKNLKKEEQSQPLREKLKFISDCKFERISYSDAFKILKDSKANKKGQFKVKVEEWGMDFGAEHERYLVEKHFKKPVIVTDYPRDLKAFYMRDNDDGKTVAAMDILFPGIGEMVGGSQREERLEILKSKMDQFGISHNDMNWYLQTRVFGTAPHSGFGIGFERLVQFVTGMKNIRDVVLYPRTPGNL